MKLLRSVVLLALLVCACVSTSSQRALVMRDVSFPMRDMRFPSGLRVLVEEDHRAPVVGVFALVGVGSTSDPPGKEGLAHYLEHLAFRARPDGKTSIWSLLGRAGAGTWNGATGWDYTLYWEVGPKESLAALLLLEGTRLLDPVAEVTPETAAVELEVVRSELRQRNETGFFGATLAHLQKAVFPAGHPYARPVIGGHASISGLSLEDARSFAKQHYRPDNITLVIVGDVDQQTVSRVIEESLPAGLRAGGGRAPGPRIAPLAPKPPAPPEASMARVEMAVTPQLWIAWSLPRSFDADGYLDQLVKDALALRASGAFWTDSDIVDVSTGLVPGKDASLLLCQVDLRSGSHPERSLEHVLDKLADIWSSKSSSVGLRPGQLRGTRMATQSRADDVLAQDYAFVNVQRSAVTSMMFGAESLVTRGIERARLAHFTGDPATYSRSLRAIMSVAPSKVMDFAYEHLTRARARALLVTPLPGSTQPPPSAGRAGEAPLDELAAPGDPKAIRAYFRAPGVSEYRQETLDNGLEVIVGRRAGLPVATVGLLLHGGACASTPAGADEVVRRVARPKVASKVTPSDFGGHLRTRHGRDHLEYLFEGAAGNVANMLELLADRVPALRVDANRLQLFRAEIPFLAKAETSVHARADRAFWSALYAGHPYGYTALASDLAAVDAGAADAWVDTITSPKNAVLAVVGEVDPEQVLAQARDTLGRWSRSSAAVPAPVPPALPKARGPVIVHRPGATQGELQFGCLLPPASGSGARYAMLARLVGDRLFRVVRQKFGASYGLHAEATTLRGGAAHLRVRGDVDNAQLAKALTTIRQAFEELGHGRFEPGEVEGARWNAGCAFGVEHITNRSIVEAILRARNEERPAASIDAFPRELTAVTAAQLRADYVRCSAAPAWVIVGDEPTVRAAVAEAWP